MSNNGGATLIIHLQKDPIDDRKGWDINMNFIPLASRDEWLNFFAKHKVVDLHDAFSDALLKQWLGIESETGSSKSSDASMMSAVDRFRLACQTPRIATSDWLKVCWCVIGGWE